MVAFVDEFKTYHYEGRITFAGPGERVRITVECEHGAGPINERSPAETVHSVMDVITREVLAPEVTQEVRFDGAEWLPRETSAATPAGGDK